VPSKISASIATCGSVIAEPSAHFTARCRATSQTLDRFHRAARASARKSPALGRARLGFDRHVAVVFKSVRLHLIIVVWATPCCHVSDTGVLVDAQIVCHAPR
jgi:hypothetical protein